MYIIPTIKDLIDSKDLIHTFFICPAEQNEDKVTYAFTYDTDPTRTLTPEELGLLYRSYGVFSPTVVAPIHDLIAAIGNTAFYEEIVPYLSCKVLTEEESGTIIESQTTFFNAQYESIVTRLHDLSEQSTLSPQAFFSILQDKAEEVEPLSKSETLYRQSLIALPEDFTGEDYVFLIPINTGNPIIASHSIAIGPLSFLPTEGHERVPLLISWEEDDIRIVKLHKALSALGDVNATGLILNASAVNLRAPRAVEE